MKKPEESKKNIAKGCSYALAFRLLGDAVKHNYPLQAIAIEESILADRLWSALNAGKEDGGTPGTLGNALGAWRPKEPSKRHHNAHLLDKMAGGCFEDLTAWWRDRNTVLHGLVKSFTGKEPEVAAADFEKFASETAEKGLLLVNVVRAASQKSIRQDKKNKLNKE